jgi:hypothetical protein
MTYGVTLLLPLLVVAAAWGKPLDCADVLVRCETARRCRPAQLRRCLVQQAVVCTMPTTTTTLPAPAEHCRRCPSAKCEADGVTCESCDVGIGYICDGPPPRHPCCSRPPQPLDCAALCTELASPEVCRAVFCGPGGVLPAAHACCEVP